MDLSKVIKKVHEDADNGIRRPLIEQLQDTLSDGDISKLAYALTHVSDLVNSKKPRRHLVPVSGKDSLATALVMRERFPSVDFEYIFNPTGAEFPSVYEWIDKVEVYLGKPIHRVGADLIELIEDNNGFLPSRLARYCTRQAKIEPFEKWIGKDECTVYYGIRSDEDRGGYENARYPNIHPEYPLKEQLDENGFVIHKGYGIEDVYALIDSVGLKPPQFFWGSVYDEVVRKVGLVLLQSLFTPWQIDILFAGRTRANCYFCFNQQKAEWVWLLETYPDLFWHSESLEHGGSEYFWNGKDYPLTLIVKNAAKIKRKHINKILKTIMRVKSREYIQQDLFGNIHTEDGFQDYLQTTSCGLFCGK
jgi:hypothetical protein